jgi:hypothetical protein
MEHEAQTEAVSALLPSGKDEMNFAEFPIALLTDRVPKDQKSIKFEDQIYDEKRKKVITRRRVIEGSEEYGLPTATDDTVILALIQVTKLKTDFTRRQVDFTRLELIRMLGWPNEGKSYDRIKLSLQRIANVTYNYDNAWWDARQKTWTTKIFHILETVEINDSRASSGQGGLFPSRIVWNEVVFDSFQSGFLRNIDFQFCMALQHPTALRMYRFLGKRFHIKPDWTFDLKEFAHDHIGLGRNYEGGTQISRKLQPAITELENVGFLEPLAENERFPKKGRGWFIRFIQKTPAVACLTAPVPPALLIQTECEPPPLVTGLTERGVTRSKAMQIVAEHSAELIQTKLEVFDWLVRKGDRRVAKNPAGYLVASIRSDYQVPGDFLPADAVARAAAAQRAAIEVEHQHRRRQRDEAHRARAREADLRARWERLAHADREAILAQVKAENPGLSRWKKMLEPLCLSELERRLSQEDTAPNQATLFDTQR